jgi:hypothetical protein
MRLGPTCRPSCQVAHGAIDGLALALRALVVGLMLFE